MLDQLDGVPIHDADIEFRLIGILLDEALAYKTANIAYDSELSTDDFYIAKLQEIWSAVSELHEANKTVSIVAVKQIIEANPDPKVQKYFNDEGIDEYLKDCVDSCIFDVTTPDEALREQINTYVSYLKELTYRRGLVRIGMKSKNLQTPIANLQTELTELDQSLAHPQTEQTSQVVEHIRSLFPETHNQMFNEFLDIHKDKSEIPESYLFFTFVSVVSMILGRKAYIQWGNNRMYTNVYIALVGRTGIDRKTSAINEGRGLLPKIAGHVQIISSIASWEGLVTSMWRDTNKLIDESLKPESTIAYIDELDGLIQKGRTEAVANLFPNLCILYDCPSNISINTKSNPVKVNNPYFSILGGIQPEVITEVFNTKDAHSGFIGRFMYVYDQATKAIPIPQQTDQIRMNKLVMELNHRIPVVETKIMLSDSVKALWTDFYNSYRFRFQDMPILCTLNQRMQNHVLKLSTIFAILDGETEIQKTHLEDAIVLGNWLMENSKGLFSELGMSDYEKVRNKVEELLKRKSMTKRELQRQISSKLSGVLLRVLKELTELQVIREDKKRKNQVMYHFIK